MSLFSLCYFNGQRGMTVRSHPRLGVFTRCCEGGCLGCKWSGWGGSGGGGDVTRKRMIGVRGKRELPHDIIRDKLYFKEKFRRKVCISNAISFALYHFFSKAKELNDKYCEDNAFINGSTR